MRKLKNQVLVTGGAGFIGSHVVEALAGQGHHVAIIDILNDFYSPEKKLRNLAVALRSDNVIHYKADVGDASALDEILSKEKPEIVIHLAATPGVRQSLSSPLHYIANNLTALQVLLNAFDHHRIGKFIFASSSSVYGNVDAIPYSEAGPVNPISPYAVTKLAGEQLCSIYASRFGFDLANLRFFSVYGPRQRPDMAIAKFADLIMQGRPLPINGSLDLLRDYTYIDDVVSAILSSVERETEGRAINVGRSTPEPLHEVISLLSQALGCKAEIDMRPRVNAEPASTCADISLAAALLGYQPRVELKEGIDRFVSWYLTTRQETPQYAAADR